MKLSIPPVQVKIKLTKIIDHSKTFKTIKSPYSHTLIHKNSTKKIINHLPSSQFIVGKQFESIDHQLYKQIISGDTSVGSRENQGFKLKLSNNKYKVEQIANCTPKKYAFFKKHQLIHENITIDKERQYAGRLTAKDYYRSIDFMNKSSPLQAWKQLSKSYTKTQKQTEHTSTHIDTIPPNNKLTDKSLELLINCQKQNLPEHLYKTQQNAKLQQLIKKWKQRQEQRKNKNPLQGGRKQDQLEDNIILRKSFSCKVSLQEFEQNTYNIQSFITDQHTVELPGLNKKQSGKYSKKGSLPTQSNDQSPIVLLHKQPLQEYMEMFFEPSKQVVSSKQKLKPLELMRIKAKKLTARNIECLERLKKNLFKDKSRRDLFGRIPSHLSRNAQKHQVKSDQNAPQAKHSPKQSSNQSLCKLLKQEGRKSGQIERVQTQNGQPNSIQQSRVIGESINKSSTETPSIQKASLSSSAISFSQEPTPEMPKTSMKGLSLINAW